MPVFEPPSSSRDVGYLSNGSGRVRELQGRPLMRETRQVRRRECQNEDTFRDFDFAHSFFVTTGPFINRRKMSFRRQHPLSLTTTTLTPHLRRPVPIASVGLDASPPSCMLSLSLRVWWWCGWHVIPSVYTSGRYELAGILRL